MNQMQQVGGLSAGMSAIGNGYANPVATPGLHQLAERLETTHKQAESLRMELMQIRDRLLGDSPQSAAVAPTGARPQRSGLVGNLQDRADSIGETLNYLHNILADLGRVV